MSGCSLRVLLASLCGAALAVLAGPDAARAGRLRVGVQKSGTFGWELAVIRARGFDREAGLDIDVVDLASTEAGKVAMAGGAVDVALLDWLWVSRERGLGHRLVFSPYSSAAGSVMVPAASPARDLAGLKGLSLGVAGGPLDKSWLLLQAAAKAQGLDLASKAKPVFGAPPLLSLKVENGELDAGLLYWTYAARLEAQGFRTVITVEKIAEQLGAKGPIAFVGFVFRDGLAEATLAGFGKAARRAETMMADDPAVWAKLRPLMKAPDEKTFEALKAAFQHGIPTQPLATEIAEATAFYATLARIGGPGLVGTATALPEGLYVDPKVYG